MQTHDDDPALDAFLGDVIRHVDRGARERPRPDFHEVVARAHREDPAAIDAATLEESANLAAVVPLSAGREPPAAADPELDAFVADARRGADAAAGERRLAGIPTPRFLAAPPSPVRRRLPTLLAGLAIAAGVLLMILPTGRELRLRSGRPTQAVMLWAADAARSVEARVSARSVPVPEDMSHETDLSSDAAPVDADIDADANADANADADADADTDTIVALADDTAADSKTRRPARRRPTSAPEAAAGDREAALTALDREAQDRWRQGDRAGAEALFRALIARDPGGRWAQLAYGDLFALSHQRGDQAAELALWEEYLARYPRGPHSDDARAGVCRRSAAADQRACWRRYLDGGPGGAYRSQAERALADAESDE